MTSVLHLTTEQISLGWLIGSQLDAFRATGYEVVTASASGVVVHPSRDASERFGAGEGPVTDHVMPAFGHDVDFTTDLRAASQLRTLLNEVKPDILHTHSRRPSALGRVVGRWSRIPIVVNTVHGPLKSGDNRLMERAASLGLERFAAGRSDAEFVHSEADFDALSSLGVSESRLHMLGYGIDIDSYTPSVARARAARCLRIRLAIPFRTPVVGIFGPLSWSRGYGEFFDVIKALRAKWSEDELGFVVGGERVRAADGGIDTPTIEHMASRYGVHFLDPANTAVTNTAVTNTASNGWGIVVDPSLLAAVDLVVEASHTDNVPSFAMAASAMGLPVVATDLPSNRQVVEHKLTGLIVRPRRSQQLTQAIERLVELPALRASLGRCGRAKAVREFDERNVIDKTLAVYRELLEAKHIDVPNQPLDRGRPWYEDSIDLIDRATHFVR